MHGLMRANREGLLCGGNRGTVELMHIIEKRFIMLTVFPLGLFVKCNWRNGFVNVMIINAIGK